MKIAFILVGNTSRTGELTGYNIRYGGASSSGTESSVIYVAEYLSKVGHQVTIALEKCNNPVVSNGVLFTDLNFTNAPDLEYDILISALWFDKYFDLPITVRKGFIYWYHLAWGYGYKEMVDFVKSKNLKVGTVSPSNWSFVHNFESNDLFKLNGIEVLEATIPNPVATDIIEEILSETVTRNSRSFVHIGQWSRGGDTALRAIQKLGWKDTLFRAFDYIGTERGLDKKSLFTVVASSEYFIYPQITHGKFVYKDTFSLSIAEAIGLGVIVLTYPLGAVPEYFGDYCQFLEYPPNVNIEKLNIERLSEEPGLDYTDNIVQKINWLEENPLLKEEIRTKGIKYISETFNIDKIGHLWSNYLKHFE